MHAFGGIIITLGVFTLYDFKVIPKLLLQLLPVWLIALVIILGWEVFKLFMGKVIDDTFIVDTVMDITIGSTGSVVGYYIANNIRHL